VFLYYKDTNPVLKYLVFFPQNVAETLHRKQQKKDVFFLLHMTKSLKDENHIVFSYNKQKFKKYFLACIFSFNNKFIKATRTRLTFKKFKKNIFFL